MTGALLEISGLGLDDGDGLRHGPLDLAVEPGQGAFARVENLDILRRLMRCCQALEKPEAGRLRWRPETPAGTGEDYDFFRRIGYVDRQSQLLSQRSLKEHFHFFDIYAGRGARPADRLLDHLGLLGLENPPTENLPEPARRLALYALALYQKPRLLLLERPRRFLERDFRRAWDLIKIRAEDEGLAFIVFDSAADIYPPGSFQVEAALAPPFSYD